MRYEVNAVMLLGCMDQQELLRSENSQVSCQSGRQVFGAWAERDTAGSSYLVGARLIFVVCVRFVVESCVFSFYFVLFCCLRRVASPLLLPNSRIRFDFDHSSFTIAEANS